MEKKFYFGGKLVYSSWYATYVKEVYVLTENQLDNESVYVLKDIEPENVHISDYAIKTYLEDFKKDEIKNLGFSVRRAGRHEVYKSFYLGQIPIMYPKNMNGNTQVNVDIISYKTAISLKNKYEKAMKELEAFHSYIYFKEHVEPFKEELDTDFYNISFQYLTDHVIDSFNPESVLQFYDINLKSQMY